MEIALSGFASQVNPQFDSTATAESARQRQRAQQQAQSPSSARPSNEQTADQQQRSRAENNTRTPATNRVINGEVLSSETSRADSRESSLNFSARSSFNQQPSNQSDNRRISAQQAIQTFQENEDLVSNTSSPRQVSGIIDEFV